MSYLASLGGWLWVVVGLALIGFETLAPGIFLVWFGIAALITGGIDLAVGLSWQSAALIFSALSLVSVGAGRLLTRRRDEASTRNPMLNRRGDAMVGRVLKLDRAIVDGEGRVRLDDTVWRVAGPDLAAGAPVRIVKVDGATLVVASAA